MINIRQLLIISGIIFTIIVHHHVLAMEDDKSNQSAQKGIPVEVFLKALKEVAEKKRTEPEDKNWKTVGVIMTSGNECSGFLKPDQVDEWLNKHGSGKK